MKPKLMLCSMLFVILAGAVLIGAAQTQSGDINAVSAPMPPLAPFLFETRFWDQQFTQWVDKDLPYMMVEAYSTKAKDGKLLDIVLLDRGTYKRTHYVNSPELANSLMLLGESAQVAKVEMKNETDSSDSPTYEFTVQRTGAAGVRWRYIQGSEVTDMGSGLTPHPSASAVVFMYREAGAVAGEGTALQVGGAVSEANLWSEISHPPYFIAYHGANTVGLDMFALRKGESNLKLRSAPEHMAAGEEWVLEDAEAKLQVHVKINKVEGDAYDVSQTLSTGGDGIEMRVQRKASGWLIESMRYRQQQGGMFLTFKPALPVGDAAAHGPVDFDMQAGKAKRVASGVIDVEQGPAGTGYEWTFKSPDWAGREVATYSVKNDQSGILLKGEIAVRKQSK